MPPNFLLARGKRAFLRWRITARLLFDTVFPLEPYRITDKLDLAFTTFYTFPRARKVHREEIEAALFHSGAMKVERPGIPANRIPATGCAGGGAI